MADRFGCTVEQIGVQFNKNWNQLNKMYQKACKTGRKVNGFTSCQLARMMDDIPMSK